jgi:hypothetical protein
MLVGEREARGRRGGGTGKEGGKVKEGGRKVREGEMEGGGRG